MSLTTVLSRSSVRILVYRHLTARRRAGVNGRRNDQCSRHCVTPLRRVSVPITLIAGGVSIPVLSTVCFGSVCTSPRAVRMSGLSVVILRSDFAMLQERGE